MSRRANSPGNDTRQDQPSVRCAIYTRKSTEEGLDQEFNSLDAQRESAELYIQSQKHEGWVCLPDRYDDGGFSGGNIERPALKRLMADVEAGKIDCLMVYKVDRLSRSILDFARLMETLERHNVSFVSVTLVAETLHQARTQNKKRVEELESEKKLLEGELKQLDAQVRKLIGGLAPDGNGAPRTTAKLADLQDRIRMNEQRATNIREELLAKSAELVDERDLASALSLFDPIWKSLSSQEQTRVMRLLVERVVYDGTNETLAITFRPTGIKALASEMNVQGGGKKK